VRNGASVPGVARTARSAAGMRLGYSIGGTGLGPAALAELAARAERSGYESVWFSEVMGTDPVALLGWVAGQTSAVGLGSAVLQMPGRSAVATAASAATLDRLSASRFRLGLGVSGPQVAEGWHGQPFDRPLARMRDYVAVVRLALAGEPVAYDGETLTLPRPGGKSAALPLLAASARAPQVPIYLAGLGPKAIALAGEIADGLLAIHCPADYIAQARPWLQAGADRGGRTLDGFDLAVMVFVHVDSDAELARDIVRPALAVYLGGMGTETTNFYNRLARRLGYRTEAARVQEAFFAGDIDEAIAALSDELVDAMTICGPRGYVARRLSAYRAAGCTTLIAGSAAPSLRMRCEQLEQLAALAGSAVGTSAQAGWA
jgi:F420-dependent oxidoreductase-like protein